MIIGIQIIGILFSFSMIYFAVLHYKRAEISKSEIFVWLTIWTFAVVVIVFPEILRGFSNAFLVTRVFDLMVIGGFVVTISLVSSSYIKTKSMEKRMEDLVRKDALKEKNSKK